MANEKKEISLTHSSDRIECGDGCCVDYIDYLVIDGDEVQITEYDSDLTIARKVLESVGYEVDVYDENDGGF